MTVGWERERATTRVMITGMIAVIAAFLASTVYTRIRSNTTARAISLAINGAPSVHLMTVARNQLRELRQEGLRFLVEGQAGALPALLAAHRRLDAAITAELQTPDYPEERPLEREALVAMAELDRLVKTLPTGALGRARYQELEAASDELDDRLDELEEVEARHMKEDAAALLASERSATARLYWIGIIDLAIAGAVMVLMIRLVRHHLWLAQRRSRELEFFAVQVAHDIFNPLVPIRVTLEACRTMASTEKLRGSIARGERSVERLRRAADELLAFARAGHPPQAGDRASPRSCLEGLGDARVRVEVVDDRPVHAGEVALDALLRTFLREAAREAAGDSPIRAVVRSTDGKVRVELRFRLSDRPPRPRELFQPRMRGRASGAPGIQLDLVAAREIVLAHGGALGVCESRGERALWFALPPA